MDGELPERPRFIREAGVAGPIAGGGKGAILIAEAFTAATKRGEDLFPPLRELRPEVKTGEFPNDSM